MVMTKQSWIKRKGNGNGVAWNKGISMPKGKDSPTWKRVTIVCMECAAHFVVKNYRKNTAHFCSHECAARYRDEGKRTADKKIRQSARYKAWRTLIFERDNYTCVTCGDHNYEGRGSSLALHADHIQPFALYPELRFEVNNGRTLCVPCHKKTGTYGRGAMYRKRCVATA